MFPLPPPSSGQLTEIRRVKAINPQYFTGPRGPAGSVSDPHLVSTVQGLGEIYSSTIYNNLSTIAIGSNAGINKGNYSVSIGYNAGNINQGVSAIAIGNLAGLNNQVAKSIIINASGLTLDNNVAGLFINPVRNNGTVNPLNMLTYLTETSELVYTTTAFTSDSNVKENIMPANLEICYSNVKALPLHRYNFIPSYAESRPDKTQVGFLAQQVSKIFPKSIVDVYDNNLSTSVSHMYYEQIYFSHYGATQLLMSTVEGQQTEISNLTATVSTHTSLINKLLDA